MPTFPDRLRENPPRQGFFEHPEYLAVRAHLARPVAGHPRPGLLLRLAQERDPSASPGRNLTRPGASSGSRRPARRRWWGGFCLFRKPIAEGPSRGAGHGATPTVRWSSTAMASPSAAGARRGALPARRPGCRPASSTIAAAPPPAPDPRQRPRAGRHAPDRPQDPRHLRPLQHHQ